MAKVKIADWQSLPNRMPTAALVEGVDLVIIRMEESVSVLYGRCQHRGALMADGYVDGENIICGVHGWDYRVETGVSSYENVRTGLPNQEIFSSDIISLLCFLTYAALNKISNSSTPLINFFLLSDRDTNSPIR